MNSKDFGLPDIGSAVKCKLSNFVGTSRAYCFHLNGTIQVDVQPMVGGDGKIPDGYYMDTQQLEVTGTAVEYKQVEFDPYKYLGHSVKDKLSKVSGIATQYLVYANGCHRIEVQLKGLTSEGKKKAVWLYVGMAEVGKREFDVPGHDYDEGTTAKGSGGPDMKSSDMFL